MRKPATRDLLLGVIGVFILYAWFVYSGHEEKLPLLGSSEERRASFEAGIRAFSGPVAYDRFARASRAIPFNDQHLAAHLFGEALYRTLSHDGISVCDSGFSFGCYHGLFIKAVSEEGLDVVASLDDACQKTNVVSACQHGIGHGILEYLGHDQLAEALSACGKTKRLGPVGGCSSGVFMEYNVPLVESEGNFSTAARPLTDADRPYGPCPEVPAEYRESCYHELPQWWRQVYGDSFGLFGRLCREAGSPNFLESCTGGIGYLAASVAGYDVVATLERCSRMPTAEMEDGCITNAAAAFSANVGDEHGALSLCAAVSGSLHGFCARLL